MAESSQLAALDTTASQEVQKAEFVTESFSIFTITWTRTEGSGWWQNTYTAEVTVHYVDEDGNEIGETRSDITGNNSSQSVIDLKDYQQEIAGYSFSKIVLGSRGEPTETEAARLRYNTSRDYSGRNYYIQYSENTTGNTWKDWLDFTNNDAEGEIYFIYESSNSGQASSTVVVGNTVTLRAGNVTWAEELDDFQGYTWVSGDTSVATVSTTDDNEPVALGVSEGSVIITGTKENAPSIKWEVTVKSRLKGSIELDYTNAKDVQGAAAINSVPGHGNNCVRYTILLQDATGSSTNFYYIEFEEDGTATAYRQVNTSGTLREDTEMTAVIAGATAPNSYTFNTDHIYLTPAVLSQMGISIPGYTFENGYAFFFWADYFGSEITEASTTELKNWGEVSGAYKNASNEYKNYIGYQRTDREGTDFKENGDQEHYFQYNATGTLRFVFTRVSENNPYHVNYVDTFDVNDPVTFEQDEMEMLWDSQTASYYGMIDQNLYSQGTDQYPLYTPTQEQLSSHPGYVFAGWYKSTDSSDSNNGTGELATTDLDEAFKTDVTYYARWVKDTNNFTVCKQGNTDSGETVILAGAKFTLEFKNDEGNWEMVEDSLVTNNNGLFTFNKLENFTIYKLTESYAPEGYEKRNSFYFSVEYNKTAPESKELVFYITDENGIPLDEGQVPEWLEYEYNPSGKKINIKLTITDELIRRNVTIIKQDKEGKPLADAVFKLQKKMSDGQ